MIAAGFANFFRLRTMTKHKLTRAIPNESFQLILQFGGTEHRVLSTSLLCQRFGWKELAYPQHLKRFVWDEDKIVWSSGGTVDAEFLYENSTPVRLASLEQQTIRLSYKNQAPTTQHKHHHVFGVYLAPFSEKLFRLDESIGGGHGDQGGSESLSLAELLARPDWKPHFQKSGCNWAIEAITNGVGVPEHLIDTLVRGACERNGMPEA